MANYVLVHGAWGGGQSYTKTAADLKAAGHNVLVSTQTGIGVRQPELHGGITLTDHVNDVEQQIEEAGMERFILVGHSYGGMVITQLAARLGSRIDAICYIDAFLPEHGESLWDITGEYEHNWYIDTQKHTPGLVAPIGGIDFEEIPGHIGRHPLLTLLEGVQLSGEEEKIPRRSYVFATNFPETPFKPFAARTKADPAWDYHEADATHMVMDDQPEQTLEILLALAQ